MTQQTAADFDAVAICHQFKAGRSLEAIATEADISREAVESIIRMALLAQSATAALFLEDA